MLGLGERAGSGLPKIREAWESLGYEISLEDSFEPFDQSVLTMRNLHFEAGSPNSSPMSSPMSSPKTDELILNMLKNSPETTTEQLAQSLGISKRAVLKRIEKLKVQGRLIRHGSSRTGHWEIIK